MKLVSRSQKKVISFRSTEKGEISWLKKEHQRKTEAVKVSVATEVEVDALLRNQKVKANKQRAVRR